MALREGVYESGYDCSVVWYAVVRGDVYGPYPTFRNADAEYLRHLSRHGLISHITERCTPTPCPITADRHARAGYPQ